MTKTFANVELSAVSDFLSKCIPFDDLSVENIQQLVRAVQILYCRQGDIVGIDDPDFFSQGVLLVRSGGLDITAESGKLVDRLAESDSLSLQTLHTDLRIQPVEDSLLYYLPQAELDELCSRFRYIDRFFHNQAHSRLHCADNLPNEPMISIGDLMSSQLVTSNADCSIRDATKRMSEHRVSSLLVMDASANGDLVGIVTDRDIRSRVVAEGINPLQPLRDIMTVNPVTLSSDASLFDAVLLMTRKGIHHVPITASPRRNVNDNGVPSSSLVGVITASDIMLARDNDPVFIVQHISRQDDVNGLASIITGLSSLLIQWQRSGMRAHQVSHILTAISESVTRRLIELAIKQLGEPPVAFCWLGFGSQSRGEQLLGADQDNGLVISDSMTAADEVWFKQLATFVCDGLAQCGYPYCPGYIMATTDSWRQTLSGWKQAVTHWVKVPTPEAVLRVSIFFDIGAIYGDKSLCQRLQQHMLASVKGNQRFLAALAENVLSARPPLGFFKQLVVEQGGEYDDHLNIKKRGLLPVIETARIHALAHGIHAVNTEERLLALGQNGVIATDDAQNLIEALRIISQVRLRNQAYQLEQQQTARVKGSELLWADLNNFLDLDRLSQLQRRQLKDAFAVVAEAQRGVRSRYLPLM